MTKIRTMGVAALASLALFATACGDDEGGSGNSAAEQAADKAVAQAKDDGVELDRDCVVDVASKLSEEDLQKIIDSPDDADVELSAEGETLTAGLVACVPKDQLIDQMMSSFEGMEGVDEDCVRGVLEELSTEEMQAMVLSEGDPTSDAVGDLTGKIMECLTIGG